MSLLGHCRRLWKNIGAYIACNSHCITSPSHLSLHTPLTAHTSHCTLYTPCTHLSLYTTLPARISHSYWLCGNLLTQFGRDVCGLQWRQRLHCDPSTAESNTHPVRLFIHFMLSFPVTVLLLFLFPCALTQKGKEPPTPRSQFSMWLRETSFQKWKNSSSQLLKGRS